jgi:hypothetical protein
MMQEELGDELAAAVREHNAPPEIPRERIWARIEAQRGARRSAAGRIRPWGWLLWPAAATAVLLIGIVIGRSWFPDPHVSPGEHEQQERSEAWRGAGPARAAQPREGLYLHAVIPYLNRIETLLTLYGAGDDGQAVGGVDDRPINRWATELLTETRLLIDSPACRDPQLRLLLDDLELVLARIVQHIGEPEPGRETWIRDGVDQRAILQRIRSRIPAGGQACVI